MPLFLHQGEDFVLGLVHPDHPESSVILRNDLYPFAFSQEQAARIRARVAAAMPIPPAPAAETSPEGAGDIASA